MVRLFESLLLQAGDELLHVLAFAEGLFVFEQCPVGVNDPSLPIRRGKSPQTLQESLVLVVSGGLIGPQALVEEPTAVVGPERADSAEALAMAAGSLQDPRRLMKASVPSLRTSSWSAPLLFRRDGGILMGC